MRIALIAFAAALALAAPAHAGGRLVMDLPETAAKGTITVTSSAFRAGGPIPPRYGAAVSPPLAWSPTPGAASYALVTEDPDAPGAQPFVHWLAWGLPPPATGLAEGGRAPAAGRNGAGGTGYFGPRPPVGDPPHHYHFEVFALDARATPPRAGADRAALVAAMRGHVLAKGDLMGLFQRR